MKITSASLIIAAAIIIGFVLSVPHTRDAVQEKIPTPLTTAPAAVLLQDLYKKGVHTISGSLLLPNPCTTLTARAELVGEASSTQKILITLVAPSDTATCLQVPQEAKFSTTVTAPANLPISALVNGTVASTTIE